MKTYSLVLTVCLIALAVEYPEIWPFIAMFVGIAILVQIIIWAFTGDLFKFFLKSSNTPLSDGAEAELDEDKTETPPHDKEEDRQTLLNFIKKVGIDLWSIDYSVAFRSDIKKLTKEEYPRVLEDEVKKIAKEEYPWVLEACIRAIPYEIFCSTAEITVGSEEEMEARYHNNLRYIEGILRHALTHEEFDTGNVGGVVACN